MSIYQNFQNRPSKYPKIVIYGQYKTGTTACFLKIRDSLTTIPKTLFEVQEYESNDDDEKAPILAKVIIPPNLDITKKKHPNLNPIELQERAEQDLNSFKTFDKQIFLVRDPRDWLISGAIFIVQERKEIYNNDYAVKKIISLLQKKEKSPKSISFIDILNMILSFINMSVDKHIIDLITSQHQYIFKFKESLQNYKIWSYEDLIANRFSHIEDYLGFRLSNREVTDPEFQHVARSKAAGNWKNWFTKEDSEYLKPLLKDYMAYFNYCDDWKLHEKPHIKPINASQYLIKTINYKLSTLDQYDSLSFRKVPTKR